MTHDALITIQIRAEGTCPGCDALNWVTIPTTGPVGTHALAIADVRCGACQATVKVTGDAHITTT